MSTNSLAAAETLGEEVEGGVDPAASSTPDGDADPGVDDVEDNEDEDEEDAENGEDVQEEDRSRRSSFLIERTG